MTRKKKKIYLGREGGEKSEIDMSHVTNPIPQSDPSRDKRTRSSKRVVPTEPSPRSRLARRSRLHQADPPRRRLGAAVTATSSEFSLLTGLHHPKGLERVSMPATEDAFLRDKARLLARRVRDVAQIMPANCDLVCVERGEHAKQCVGRRREKKQRGRHLLGKVKPICILTIAHTLASLRTRPLLLCALLRRQPRADGAADFSVLTNEFTLRCDEHLAIVTEVMKPRNSLIRHHNPLPALNIVLRPVAVMVGDDLRRHVLQ